MTDEGDWQPIETAPHDTSVLLGWWREWPELRWETKVGKASSGFRWKVPGKRGIKSTYSRHPRATHWRPLPPPGPRPPMARDIVYVADAGESYRYPADEIQEVDWERDAPYKAAGQWWKYIFRTADQASFGPSGEPMEAKKSGEGG